MESLYLINGQDSNSGSLTPELYFNPPCFLSLKFLQYNFRVKIWKISFIFFNYEFLGFAFLVFVFVCNICKYYIWVGLILVKGKLYELLYTHAYIHIHIIHLSYLLLPTGHHFIAYGHVYGSILHVCKHYPFCWKTAFTQGYVSGIALLMLRRWVSQHKNLGLGLSIHENLKATNVSGHFRQLYLDKQIP